MSSQSRRRFLEQSMFTTAAALALKAQQTQANEPQQQPPSIGPNDTIQVAVIGAGGRGQSHIDGFAGRPGSVVTHICDCDEKAGQRSCDKAAEKQGGKKPVWVKDVRKLLEDKSINAVSIATPNHWHSLGAIWAIQAGKDVYVEKPVSHNVLEGRRVVQAARKHQRMVQTGTQSRSNPGMREAMEFIHAGGIGDVSISRGLCYKRRDSIGPRGTYEVPKEVDYDLWSGPAKILPLTRKRFHYDWHWQWEYGNGDLGNQGIHQMDLCRWALGEDRLSDRVWSFGGRLGYEDAGESANTQVVVHDYGNRKLIFEVRGLPTPDYKGANVGIIVEGTKGYLVMTSYASGTAFDLDGKPIKQFNGVKECMDVLVGTVGEGPAIELRKFSERAMTLEQIQAVLADPSGAKLPSELGDLYALVAYLISTIGNTWTQDACGVLLGRLPVELAVLLARDTLRVSPGLRKHERYAAFIKEHAKSINPRA